MKITKRSNFYNHGEWDVICDKCGKKRKISEVKKQWDGFLVCEEHWDRRHPQDFPAIPRGTEPVPLARPEPDDVFIDLGDITANDL